MGITSFLIFHSALLLLRLVRNGLNGFANPEEPFRVAVFFQIPLLLLRGKAAEGFAAAIADEKSPRYNVNNLPGIFIPDCPIQGQTIDFAFFVTDNADLLRKASAI